MAQINIHEAKTHLSRLLKRAQAGEEIVIASAGAPVARLVPIRSSKPRLLGQDAGRFTVPEDFNAPLPDDLLASFEGSESFPGKPSPGARRPRKGAGQRARRGA